jgi:hypothetical protein
MVCCAVLIGTAVVPIALSQTASVIGREISVAEHLRDGQQNEPSLRQLIYFGEKLFSAKWTIQEGAGRPVVKGTANGPQLSDPSQALVFPRNFNRISGPDSNSCKGCHNDPFEGAGGDRATLVFVLGQRFDFATFDHADMLPSKGATDELGSRSPKWW